MKHAPAAKPVAETWLSIKAYDGDVLRFREHHIDAYASGIKKRLALNLARRENSITAGIRIAGVRAENMPMKLPLLPSASSNATSLKPTTRRGLPSGSGTLEKCPAHTPVAAVTVRSGCVTVTSVFSKVPSESKGVGPRRSS